MYSKPEARRLGLKFPDFLWVLSKLRNSRQRTCSEQSCRSKIQCPLLADSSCLLNLRFQLLVALCKVADEFLDRMTTTISNYAIYQARSFSCGLLRSAHNPWPVEVFLIGAFSKTYMKPSLVLVEPSVSRDWAPLILRAHPFGKRFGCGESVDPPLQDMKRVLKEY